MFRSYTSRRTLTPPTTASSEHLPFPAHIYITTMSSLCLDRRTPLIHKLRTMISTAITLNGPHSLQPQLLQEIDDTVYWWFNNRHPHDREEDHIISGCDFLIPRGHPSQRRASWRKTKRCRRRERMLVRKEERDSLWAERLKVYIIVGVKGFAEGNGEGGFALEDLLELPDEMVRWEAAPEMEEAGNGDDGEDEEDEKDKMDEEDADEDENVVASTII